MFYQMPKSNGKITIKWSKIKVWLTITQLYISMASLLKLQMTQTVSPLVHVSFCKIVI